MLLLGATGRTGSRIVQLALQDGHEVTALVRTPEKMLTKHDKLTIVQGDVLNKGDLQRATRGVDAVISALNTDGTNALSDGMPLIIEAMRNNSVQRLITIGTAGILQSRTTPGLRYQSSDSKRKSVRAAIEHHKVYELLRQSTLDWTIVCPTYLPDGEYRGNYRTERDYLPEGGAEISVGDTAAFTYSQLDSNEFIRSRVGICY